MKDCCRLDFVFDKDDPVEVDDYQPELEKSWVYKEIHAVRNIRPASNSSLGLYGGILYAGREQILLRNKVPWTFASPTADYKHLKNPRPTAPLSSTRKPMAS